jgi:biotin carboxyl carrier protein
VIRTSRAGIDSPYVRRGLAAAGLPSLLAVVLFAACGGNGSNEARTADVAEVVERSIRVMVEATGNVEPIRIVEVKSKASGEIQELRVETGQVVKRGDLMVRVDPRIPRNAVAQAQADLEVAQARLTNAASQRRRADELFKSQSITEQEHEQALLDHANANAEVIRAQVALDNARDQLDDTNVRAPIGGTIIEKQVERGQVISSPTNDVGGGTVLLKMDNRTVERVRELARQEQTTSFAVLLAAFQVLLHRYTGQDDILVGSPMFGRSRPEFAEVVGDFVNMVVLRGDLRGSPSFRSYLHQRRETVLGALKHQAFPFSEVVNRLKASTESSRKSQVEMIR